MALEFPLTAIHHPPLRRSARAAVVVAALGFLTACQGMSGSGDFADDANGPLRMTSPLGSYLAGIAARNDRDMRSAAKFFENTLDSDPDNLVLARGLMIAAATAGQMDKALGNAARVAKGDPRDPVAGLILASEALRTDRSTEALARLGQASRASVYGLLVPISHAWALYGAGRVDDGLKELQTLKDSTPFAPFAIYHIALMNDAAGRTQAAEGAYAETLRTGGPSSPRVIEAYGSLLERTGRIGDAERLYRDFAERQGDNPAIEQALERVLGGKPADRLISTAAAGAAEGLYSAALALGREEEGDLALLFNRLAVHMSPDLDVGRLLLGERLERAQRYEDAAEIYRSIDRGSAYAISAKMRLAWALHQLKRDDEAVVILREAAALDRTDTDALMTLGDILRGGNKYTEAASEYGRAIDRLNPPTERHWSLYYARGIAYEQAKQWPRAEADFLKALELRPDQPAVLNYLGYSWIEQGMHLERARQMVERAVALRPNDGYIVDSLGWALYRLGKYEEAVVHLERAVELKPVDPVINDHLGDAYWKVGRKNEARFQWERALSFKPQADQVPLIRAKLGGGLVESAARKSDPRGGG